MPPGRAPGRAQFALAEGVRHFDAFLFAAHPKPVRDAIARHRAGLDAGANAYLHAHQAELEDRVARNAEDYLGVGARELAFTDSTAGIDGVRLVTRGIPPFPRGSCASTWTARAPRRPWMPCCA